MLSPLHMVKIYFLVIRCPDGTVHVQNVIGPYLGQHHVHTMEGYERWRRHIEETLRRDAYEFMESEGACDCGLEPGWVREYDGRVWYSGRWE